MILQSNGLHITLIADDMHPLDTTIDAIFTEICTAYQDQMPILAATIKQVLKKNPVANTVSASLPGTELANYSLRILSMYLTPFRI